MRCLPAWDKKINGQGIRNRISKAYSKHCLGSLVFWKFRVWITYFLQNIWDNIKRSTKAKLDKAAESGSGSVQLTPLDEIVADALGSDEPHMTGLGQEDDDPVLPGSSGQAERQDQNVDSSNFDTSFSSNAGNLQVNLNFSSWEPLQSCFGRTRNFHFHKIKGCLMALKFKMVRHCQVLWLPSKLQLNWSSFKFLFARASLKRFWPNLQLPLS